MQLTEANYQREKKLFEAHIAPLKDVIEAETAYQEAIINFKSCEDLLKLHGLSPREIAQLKEEPDAVKSPFPIISPISGEIIETISIFTEKRQQVLTIPRESVQTDGEHSFVFIVLATVVVGEAVTATLLTLFMLPTLNSLLERKKYQK